MQRTPIWRYKGAANMRFSIASRAVSAPGFGLHTLYMSSSMAMAEDIEWATRWLETLGRWILCPIEILLLLDLLYTLPDTQNSLMHAGSESYCLLL